jgi:hypothetical protein
LVETIRNAKADLEIIMADSEPAKNRSPQKCSNCGGEEHTARTCTKEVQPMEETIPFPQESSKTLEEETAEFLELLLRIGFELEEQDAE